MALYEHIFIARPDISPQQVEAVADLIKQTLEEGGGKVCKQEYWGLKSLAYPIEKNARGHYTLLNIDAAHDAMLEVDRKLRLNDDVMRHISVRVDEHETGDSVQIRSKSRDDNSRDSRDSRDNETNSEDI